MNDDDFISMMCGAPLLRGWKAWAFYLGIFVAWISVVAFL
jgi:hypothetical protein